MSDKIASNRAFVGRGKSKYPLSLRHTFEKLRALWRHIRVSKPLTALMGPQYAASRDRIEIDITYSCNLRCINCNRSVGTAPSGMSLSVGQIDTFIEDSLSQGRRWRSIRILGGEPTLHPDFREILVRLVRYRDEHLPECSLELVTNGFGPKVREQLEWVPSSVWVENSAKTSAVNPGFRPFSDAPIDDPTHVFSDYSNGCEIMETCGMGFGPTGYFQCAIAAGIDRVAGLGLGMPRLPFVKHDYKAARCATCKLCGRFKDGHHVPLDLRPALRHEVISPSWRRIYDAYEAK